MTRLPVAVGSRAASRARRRPAPRARSKIRARATLTVAAVLGAGMCSIDSAGAHGFAGKRFFPATLATDDPFVADELSLPTVARRRTVEDGAAITESSASIDFSKRLTPDFGVGLGASWVRLDRRDGARVQGFDNFALSAKYQFFKSDAHETIASIGVDADLGGTGARRIGDSFSTITPTVFVGRGFGDLPEEMRFLRPLAMTGSLGIGVPTRAASASVDDDGNPVTQPNPRTLKLGLALEYSLPYLHAFVKDIGLPAPLRNAIPIVEFALEKPIDRGRGPTTGTINPGLLFPGRTMQFGIEAVVPVNRRTGGGVGVLLQLHFFIDDLFPRTIGKPLFGG